MESNILPVLQELPQTENDWRRFSFHHRKSHSAIRQAIQAQKGVTLFDNIIDPINPDDFEGFLERNQREHNDMNAAINVQSQDLQELDPRDIKQLSSWIFAHYQEHNTAETKLGIAS